MPASRAKAIALAMGFLVLAPTALAQQPGKPLVITSPALEPAAGNEAPPAPVGSPVPEAGPTSGPIPKAEFPGGPPKAPPRFEMEELSAPDPDGFGALGESQGGLGKGMWHGTQAATVRKILPTLPAASGSRTMQLLTRRLLLSSATPPEGNRGLTPSLMELRAERLYAMGSLEGLGQLLKASPSALASPGLARIEIDTWLLAGEAKTACEKATVQAQTVQADPRLTVFCQITAGKTLEAGMALDLMRERKDADHAFIAAAEAMTGIPPAKVTKLPEPLPLHLAAFKAAKLPLPADVAANAPPSMLRAIADNPAMQADIRITAAERAESLGVLEVEGLRRLMTDLSFTPAEIQAAQAQGDKSPRGRALALLAAGAENAGNARGELIARILMAAEERRAFAAASRLYAALIADLQPLPELNQAAPLLARALYAAGRTEAAEKWLALARTDPAAAKAAAGLWPLARISRIGLDPSPADSFAAWLATAQPNERRIVVTMSMLQAIGEPVPASAWLAHSSGDIAATAAKPALMALLRAAALGARRAEVVMLTAAIIGEGHLVNADPDTVGRLVTFLRQAGFEREARDLAVEMVLANGG
jgi:hypothetical protein